MLGIFVTKSSVGIAWSGGTCPEAALELESITEVAEGRVGVILMGDGGGNLGLAIVYGVGQEPMPRIPVNLPDRRLKGVGPAHQGPVPQLQRSQSMLSKKPMTIRIFRGVLSKGWRKDSH